MGFCLTIFDPGRSLIIHNRSMFVGPRAQKLVVQFDTRIDKDLDALLLSGEMAGEQDAVEGVSVRYGCKCGHWTPVSAMFFSELCQKPVCRRPSCSVEEIESFYCGHLLMNLSSKEAGQDQNRSNRCFSCPSCNCVLSTAFHEDKQRYFFFCGHCRWDSLELGLAEEDQDMLVMSAIARERESPHEDVFHMLLSHHSAMGAGAIGAGSARGRLSGLPGSLLSLQGSIKDLQREQQMKKSKLQRLTEMGGWRAEQTQKMLQEREQWIIDQRCESQWPSLQAQLAALPSGHAEGGADQSREQLTNLATQREMSGVSSLPQRLLNMLEQPREASQVFLSRPPLRVKRTWRCVESIEKGSPGILVKPQMNPMSGDSSMPMASSWFKKAHLAVHYLPIVTFQRLPWRVGDSDAVHCVLLVENPLDDPIRIVFHPSNADGGSSDAFSENGQVGSGVKNGKVMWILS